METEKRTILYTIGCPNCKVLERRLEAKKIPYDTVTDLEIMKQKGIKSAPFLEVDGELMNFGKALQWVSQYGNNN